MWYEAENGENVKPAAVDERSSRVYVYVRRGFVFVPASGEGEEAIPAHWRWEEMKIPREMWEVARMVLGHEEALDDVYAALTELAELIEEG